MGVGKGDRVILYMPMIPEAAYAMLACARIGAIHSIVFGWVLSRRSGRTDHGCDAAVVVTADEAPRGGRNTPLKANVGRGLRKFGRRQDCWSCSAPAAMSPETPARSLVARDGSRRPPIARPPNERRRPAVHPLYLRLDRQPKGVVHTSGGYLVYASMTHEYVVRLPRRRYLLVHGRCRLGDRPQLHRLWPACQRRDDLDVRGRADLSRCLALLASLRKAQGEPVLHCPHRHPRADGQGTSGLRKPICSSESCSAPWASRSTRRPGTGIMSRWRRALPDRRHLVADRNRRPPDYPPARCDRRPSQARPPNRSFGIQPGDLEPTTGEEITTTALRACCASPIAGRARCGPFTAITIAS